MTKQKKKSRKADSTEIQRRVNAVYAMLLQGYQRKAIIQYSTENFQIKERAADEYIAKAREIMAKDQEVEIETKKTEIISQYYNLLQKNMKIEDYREARAVLKDISEVLGIRVQKIDHTTGGKPMQEEIDYEKLSKEALLEIERLGKEKHDEYGTS